ncbi:MAG TPA: formate dehydrogenase accessory protein FdhE [Terriglobales bacterium]|nr:formate dehydrogenase accessory protein FdhE [Terriglobales bacterium]
MAGKDVWETRIRRAEELIQRQDGSSAVLGCYRAILPVQQWIAQQAPSAPRAQRPQVFCLQDEDVDLAIRGLPRLVDALERHGPAKLASEAARLRDAGHEEQRQAVTAFLAGQQLDRSRSFFVRVLVQPLAETLAWESNVPEAYTGSTCPKCGSRPQLAVLRPEGDGGKRHLVCSLCFCDWEYRRILCPVCGETEHTRLPRYQAEDYDAVRVEACDTCKSYLKSFDMTIDGLLVPEVDEIATIALDLWAGKQGYRKIQLNVMGF